MQTTMIFKTGFKLMERTGLVRALAHNLVATVLDNNSANRDHDKHRPTVLQGKIGKGGQAGRPT